MSLVMMLNFGVISLNSFTNQLWGTFRSDCHLIEDFGIAILEGNEGVH